MTKLTVEEIAARIAASSAKRPSIKSIDNSQRLKDSGCRIIHLNGSNPMTIAYQQINKSHVKVATAVCHKSDTFSKKRGTKTALDNFAKGNTIVLPLGGYGVSRTSGAGQMLIDVFGVLYF